MQYRQDKHGENISVLGYGCMRFTKNGMSVDIDKTEKEIMTAYENGVNYFDTAYVYPGSEAALGEILERNGIRKSVKIATKLPHYMMKSYRDLDRYFSEELRRLRTDYVDYYLIHMLNDVKTWDRLCQMGILRWIEQKKADGVIKNIGFSYHGNADMFCKLLDAYDWDFAQIQYNYLDENTQAGRTGAEYAEKKHIPLIIMEPLRGGKLANNLPKEAMKMFRDYPVKKSPARWSFDWLWDQSCVTCALSGMNSVDMVIENILTADNSRVGKLTEADRELLKKVVSEINKNTNVPCTGCRYCMPCHRGVDIPGIFSAYNSLKTEGFLSAERQYFMATSLRKDFTGASNCIECGACEIHCPQGIEIRKELKNAKKVLENPIFTLVRKAAGLFVKY